jgi:twitching motility protein PilT
MSRITELNFSDLYYTPEHIAYIPDKRLNGALIVVEPDDLQEYVQALESCYTGSVSYSMVYDGVIFRIERTMTLTGPLYSARRMPRRVPDISRLGLPDAITNHLLSLVDTGGLILWGGATGQGKTTSISCLLKKFLEMSGGFAYTIEDPPEMPLDGTYRSNNGGLGLCKQTETHGEEGWGESLKSALRSRPRYILVGEIRTPETASQVLRASSSGHLVLSTIHANSVEDALNSVIKYATASGLNESLAADLLSRGLLAVIHQRLVNNSRPEINFCFANPDPMQTDQVRVIVRSGQIVLGTVMEAQTAKLFQNKPLFRKM